MEPTDPLSEALAKKFDAIYLEKGGVLSINNAIVGALEVFREAEKECGKGEADCKSIAFPLDGRTVHVIYDPKRLKWEICVNGELRHELFLDKPLDPVADEEREGQLGNNAIRKMTAPPGTGFFEHKEWIDPVSICDEEVKRQRGKELGEKMLNRIDAEARTIFHGNVCKPEEKEGVPSCSDYILPEGYAEKAMKEYHAMENNIDYLKTLLKPQRAEPKKLVLCSKCNHIDSVDHICEEPRDYCEKCHFAHLQGTRCIVNSEDFYTKEEEREWRAALLDVLIKGKHFEGDRSECVFCEELQDLRSRFL